MCTAKYESTLSGQPVPVFSHAYCESESSHHFLMSCQNVALATPPFSYNFFCYAESEPILITHCSVGEDSTMILPLPSLILVKKNQTSIQNSLAVPS